MKPKQVANWLLDNKEGKKPNIERLAEVMELKDLTKLRKILEDQEVMKERLEKRAVG